MTFSYYSATMLLGVFILGEVKKVSVSFNPEDVEFLENFEGKNFSDKIRNVISSYKIFSDIILKTGRKLKEKEIDLKEEDYIIEWITGEKFKVNGTHIKAVAKFRKELEKTMSVESSWDFIKMLMEIRE